MVGTRPFSTLSAIRICAYIARERDGHAPALLPTALGRGGERFPKLFLWAWGAWIALSSGHWALGALGASGRIALGIGRIGFVQIGEVVHRSV